MPEALAVKSSKGKDTMQAQKHFAEVARQPVPTSPGGAILALKRSAGNQAVSHLLGQGLRTSPSTSGLLQRKCACGNNAMAGGGCEECGKKQRLGLQTKLKVNEPGDIYEQEADRIADQVMATPAPHAVSNAPPRIQRFAGQPAGQAEAAPASVNQALSSPGRPLEPALRQDMEQRFGYDFSRVRVHSGAAAEQSARDVNAHAYTVGHDIVFGAGKFALATPAGRRLLAHELAHTVQQSGGDLAIQRFVPCTRARMSLEECPKREPGEESESRRDPMIVEFITAPEVGYLIANFDIGGSKLKASAKGHPNWPTLISTISQAGSQWELWGLTDCHGAEARNKMLRKQRADAVRAALPPAAAAHIIGSSDASLGDCITDNENRIAREWNRAVLITAVRREMDLEPFEIEGTRKIEEPDTEGCGTHQRDALAQAFPLAKEMVRAALGAIDDEDLMKQYFGEDAPAHRYHIKQNFEAILQGLEWKGGPTFECNEGVSWYCDDAHAMVIPIVGRAIHICPSAIALGVDFLARTIVHECAHGFAFVFIPDESCVGGWPSSKDTTDAEDNADCYGEFAGDALAKSP